MGTDCAQETENIVCHSNPDVNMNNDFYVGLYACLEFSLGDLDSKSKQVTFGDQLSCSYENA